MKSILALARPAVQLGASLALLLAAGCGGGEAPPTTGRYLLDADHFAETLADQLIEMGKIEASVRSMAVAKLKSANFTLDLAEDATFRAEQKILGKQQVCTGDWTLRGSAIRLDQTHEDGQEAEDEMTGTLEDGTMTLHHQEDGTKVTLVLRHAGNSSPAATPR